MLRCCLQVSPTVNCRHLVPFTTTGQRLTWRVLFGLMCEWLFNHKLVEYG